MDCLIDTNLGLSVTALTVGGAINEFWGLTISFFGLVQKVLIWSKEIWISILEQPKGRIISKGFFDVFDFLQKKNEEIRLYYYDTSSRLVFVRVLEEIETISKLTDLKDLAKFASKPQNSLI